MAVIRQRVDDVLYKHRNKTVEATERMRVSVPGAAVDSSKSVRIEVDVSDQGKTLLAEMESTAREATRKAWAPILALKAQPKKKAEPGATELPGPDLSEDDDPPAQEQFTANG